MVDVLLGLQWGDEGKGKIVDYLANDYSIIARFQGGPNAGHTLYVEGQKVVLHTIPSGIFHAHCLNLIGNGVVIDPVTLKAEIEKIKPLCPDMMERLFVGIFKTVLDRMKKGHFQVFYPKNRLVGGHFYQGIIQLGFV
ncbi:MAG: hypothetical protein EBV15_11550 [Bacteroidetes bacterium]|nr:hypothetical protein [Bacteroidota bacterium]